MEVTRDLYKQNLTERLTFSDSYIIHYIHRCTKLNSVKRTLGFNIVYVKSVTDETFLSQSFAVRRG